MIALLYYVTAGMTILWQLPRVRASGQRRTTLVWVLLWIGALALGGIYFCLRASWAPSDWVLK